MESIYVSQKDMLEICQDGDKYFLRLILPAQK